MLDKAGSGGTAAASRPYPFEARAADEAARLDAIAIAARAEADEADRLDAIAARAEADEDARFDAMFDAMFDAAAIVARAEAKAVAVSC